MAANNGFPMLTTAGQGLFNGPSSTGYIQGQAQPDPATRFALRSAIVSQDETIPMWGGLGIYANISPISASGPREVLGEVVGRANSLTGAAKLVGFTVFDQAYNMVNDPSNPVPTAGSGQSINYYPLGCRARVAVKCAASLIALRGSTIAPQVSWDFIAQELIPYSGAYPQTAISNAVWASTGGGQTTFTVGTDLTGFINTGDFIEVAGVVSTGGTGVGFNGQFEVVSITSGSIVVSQPAASSPGTYSSDGDVLAGGGALPVVVLDVQPSGCMTVENDGTYTTYNFDGACALIQLTGGTTA